MDGQARGPLTNDSTHVDDTLQLGTAVNVASGAAALSEGSIAAGERAVIVKGNVEGPIVTGDENLNLFIGDLTTGLQGQAIQHSLQALLSQAFTAAIQPQIEVLFQVVRDPAQVPAALFGPDHRRAAVRPYDVPYQARPGEASLFDQHQRALLLRGRRGLGRTRQAAELARQLCADGWTICVARLENCRKMREPAGVLPDKKILCVIDDLHRHVLAGSDASYMDRLAACLQLFERDPDVDLLLLATWPADDDQPEITSHPLWQSFAVSSLSDLPAGTLQAILESAAKLAGVTIPEEQRAELVAASDGTPKTMVENVNQASLAGEPLTLDRWHNTWRGTWETSYHDTRGRYPLADAVCEAVYLLQTAGLPARMTYVRALATARAQADVTDTTSALVQRGFLRADGDEVVPFAEEQIEVSLQGVGRALPDLTQQWQPLIEAVTTSAGAPADDLVVLAETLNDYGRHADAESTATAVLVQDAGHGAASFQRGLARAQQDNYRGAAADFTTALAAGHRPGRARLMRGLTHFMLADYPAAETDFSEAIADGERLAYKGRGLARIFQQAFADAIPDLTEALATTPGEGDLYYLRALAHNALKEEKAALADFTTAIGTGFDGPSAYFGRGWLHWQMRDPAAAEADFTHVLEETSNAFLYLARGMARTWQDNPAGAEADFTEAIVHWQDDTYLAVLQEMGQTLAEEGSSLAELLAAHPEWVRVLVQALPGVELPEAAPAETLVGMGQFWGQFMEDQLAGQGLPFASFTQLAGLPYLGRGNARLVLEAYADAAADFTAAAELGADPAATYYGLGLSRLGMGNAQSAVTALSRAIAAGQEPVNAYYWRGFAHLALANHEAAVADLTAAIARGRDDALVYALRGRATVALGQLQSAEADFSAAIDRDPSDPAGYFMRGAVRHDLGQYTEAEADFNAAVAGGYDAAPLYSLRGWSRFQQEKYGLAEADFTATLARDPEVALAYYGRAAARYNQGHHEEAEADFTAAFDRGFEHPIAYLERGMARLETGDFTRAEADSTKALALGLDDGRAYHVRGWARLRQGQAATARSDLDTAIEQGFAEAITYYGRALVAYHLDEYESAVADYSEAISRGLGGPAVYAERGAARLRLADYAGAEADLSRAIAEGMDDGDVYLRRAQARVGQEDYAGAVADCSAAIRRGQDGIDVIWGRGLIYFDMGKYEEAVSDLSEVLRREPDNADVLLIRGRAYYCLRQYDSAVADATQVLAQDAENAFAWQLRGSARAHLGQVGPAQEDCQQAQHLAPDDPITDECWGDLYMAQGAYDQAAASYQAALRKDPDAGRHFGTGLACLLADRTDEGTRAYETGLAGAGVAELQMALHEMDHWRGRRQTPLAAGVEAALQTVRRQLEAALAAQSSQGEAQEGTTDESENGG